MPTHHRACNLCEAICGLEIEYEGSEVLSIKGDPKDPLSRGHICPKAVALQDLHRDPDRLKHPVRRTAGGWERIGWEEAFEEVASRLRTVQEKHGRDAVGVYLGNPNVHNLGSMLFSRYFLKALGTKNRFSATSADQLPHHVAALELYGHSMLLPVPDLDRTEFLLILGANPLVSNGSMMTAPDIAKRLRAIQQRGGRIVTVDPRRTETAGKADQHFFIRPGQDAWLLLAMVHTILEEGLADPGHLAGAIDGLDTLRQTVQPYTPEAAADLTGITAADIRRLARDFAAAESAVCYGRLGVSTQAFGGLCQWLVNVLNILTGNLDRAGGAMFTHPAFDYLSFGRSGVFGNRHTRVRGLPGYSGEFPVAALAEEILTPGEGQIRALVTIAGNPVLSTPNGRQLDEAFRNLDFLVAVDIFINETTRHADLILPPTCGLETEHYDLIFHLLAVRNTAKYSPPLFPKGPQQRHDWQIFQGLTEALTGKPGDGATPSFMLDFALRSGPYGKEGMSLDHLRDNPHGIDLGPLRACLPERLFTPGKRINLAPDIYRQDLARLKETRPPHNTYPLRLIGRRDLRSNNSWMHNAHRLVKGPERCTLLIHPQDADALGVTSGTEVMVRSRTGAIRIQTEVSDEVMPGVVSIPHGWGHDRDGVQLTTARAHAGASINDLTDDQLVDELTGNAAFSNVPVRVESIGHK